MRVVVVAPGHAFSTLDVYTGLCAGLRANGVQVFEYPLHTTLETMELLVGAAKFAQIAPPAGYPDPLLLASATIPSYVMAKRPDWTIVVHGLNVPPSIPETLRRGGYRTAVLLTESPYQMDEERRVAGLYDMVFTNERLAVDQFTDNQPGTVHHLPHAYNPAVHTLEGPRAEPCDVFFCGTRYPERDALLNAVDWTGINVCDRTIHYIGDVALDDIEKKVLSNHDVASYYRSAKIALNQHRVITDPVQGATIAAGSAASLNPRAYEIPACGGALMISDVRADLEGTFGDSVPTYADAAELERLVRYYLAHESERQALAARQHAAVRPHSWTARGRAVLDALTTPGLARRAA